MSLRYFVLTGCALFFCAHLSNPSYAQNAPPSRGMPSDDFANNRPQPTTDTTGRDAASPTRRRKSAPTRRKEGYKPAGRVDANMLRPKQTVKPQPKPTANEPLRIEELGVTLWRLRASRAADTGPKVAVKTGDNVREWWTPERVGADTQFQDGDRVRLTIESRQRGYLYVINGEMYANGQAGKLFLIFPAPANQDSRGLMLAGQLNQVEAGLLVDIPDQAEDYPYFNIEPKSPDYAGELLLIIISPTPLQGLRLGPEQEIENVELVSRWADMGGGDAELFVKEGGSGEAFTSAEHKALCGAKTRQLVREKQTAQTTAPSPCGPLERRLTREDPLPQSIYRVSIPQAGPLIVPVRLTVSRSGRR